MTDTNSSNLPTPEDQSDRWLKYGGNVALASLAVIAIAALVVYLAQRPRLDKRIDTTANGQYSLKQQTLDVIKANKKKISIVSLYTKPAPSAATDDHKGELTEDQLTAVNDLLAEYKARDPKISVDWIDNKNNPEKVTALIEQVADQYKDEVARYKKFTDDAPASLDTFRASLTAESEAVKNLHLEDSKSEDSAAFGEGLRKQLSAVLEQVDSLKRKYNDALHQRPPAYKPVTDAASSIATTVSEFSKSVTTAFNKYKDDTTLDASLRQYMAQSIPRWDAVQKQGDDLVAKAAQLGDLKLDTLRDALKVNNPILVRSDEDKDWKVIPYDDVWKVDTRDNRAGSSDATPKPRFFGEQAITAAVHALNQTHKPKICFVRNGGPPISDDSSRMTFGSLADRLKKTYYDVQEKDLSGQWAMQAMQQQQMAPPEPSDADIADAVWVVLPDSASRPNPMAPAPPVDVAAKVADHLAKGTHYVDGKPVPGGSVLVLPTPQGENLSAALAPFGIRVRTDLVAVHPQIKAEGGNSNVVNEAEKSPLFFAVTDWGDAPFTASIRSLPGIVVRTVVVEKQPVDGVNTWQFAPLVSSPPGWGKSDPISRGDEPKFDDKKDVAAPIFGGAAADKPSGGRVVVFGSIYSLVGSTYGDGIVDFPDMELARRGIYSPQFPGNAEIFLNSVYWLNHDDAMLGTSPATMSVPVIANISNGQLGFWRYGVLLTGLPLLVIAAGAGVYFYRRD